MIYEKIQLNQHTAVSSAGVLEAYVLDNSPEIDPARVRPAVLICPGGGYAFTSDREAECFAVRFLAQGYHAFVLRYSVAPARYPTQLLEAAAAMSLLRQNAAAWHIDPERIAVMGFSAGGHLAASLATRWNSPLLEDTLGQESAQFKPSAQVLCYPVITSGKFAHRGSFENLLGAEADAAALRAQSLEYAVGEHVPPAFLWHTLKDTSVPCENSLCFAHALRVHHVPFELHIYPEGRHGLGLCGYETAAPGDAGAYSPHTADWFPACCRWLDMIFLKHVGA